MAFSPDGNTIISGSSDNTIRLWRLDGTPIGQPFEGHSDSVNSVAFSPDGNTIISGSSDKTIRLWTLKGNPIGQPFEGHSGPVGSVAFSPDGNTIISGINTITSGIWYSTVYLWKHISPTSWLRTCCQRIHNNWTHDPDLIACRTCLTEEAAIEAEAGNFQAAIPLFEKAIATKTRFLITSEATGETIPFHSDAAANTPAKQAIHKQAKQKVAPYIIQHGKAHARSGDYNQALEHFTLAKEYDPNLDIEPTEKAKHLTVPILIMQAKIQILSGDRDTAHQTHEQIKELDPTAATEIDEWLETH